MMLLDGKRMSQKILSGLAEEINPPTFSRGIREGGGMKGFSKKLRLAVIVAGKDPVVAKFIEQKKKTGESVGIDVRVYPFDEMITTNELRKRIAEIVHEKKNTGVIIQLPLPPQINKQYILNSVVPEKDVDMLSARALGSFIVGRHPTGRVSDFSPIMPPVAGAVKAFFEEYGIKYSDKNIVVLGAGSLVGRPVMLWLLQEGITISVITENSPNPQPLISQADIIISGIGKPRFVTGDMVKKDVIVIDAGTSESEGKMVGDIDFDSVSQKASFITPVPGGVGPLTVAMLFKNLVTLAKNNE